MFTQVIIISRDTVHFINRACAVPHKIENFKQIFQHVHISSFSRFQNVKVFFAFEEEM